MNSKKRRDRARAEAHARRQCFCFVISAEKSTLLLPCCKKHAHECCLIMWFERSKTCPFCRACLDLRKNELLPSGARGLVVTFEAYPNPNPPIDVYDEEYMRFAFPSGPTPFTPADWAAIRAEIRAARLR